MHRNQVALRDKLRTLVTQNKLDLIQKALAQRSRYVSYVFEHFYHEHNIHAAMRSIEGCGFQDIHVIDNEKKIDAELSITKGADYWLTTYQHTQQQTNNTQVCFQALKETGYLLVGATPHQRAYTLAELPLDRKIALVFGNERIGLSEHALNQVDTYVTIPMYGFTESFNVSASVTVAAYELRKRLQQSELDWQLTLQEKFDLELTWLKRIVRGSEFIEKSCSE
jgi:tRNA (guanosine-2'-O-)-methyltransferase